VVEINAPPLIDRIEDIPFLVAHFIEKFQPSEKREIKLAPEVWKALYTYTWPGNIRELENTIERALVMSSDETITLGDLPDDLVKKKKEKIDLDKIVPRNLTLAEALEQIEGKLILRALKASNNVQSKAAEMLGISRRVMHYKIKKYGMLT
jgi:two-component system NtrC family response regulator